MTQRDIYAFDCGTTNWRIYRLSCEQDANGGRPLSDPQRVALTTFKGSHLPAALLLDERNQVRSYGDNAYEQARDAEWRPYLRDAFKLCLGNRQSVDLLEPRRRYTHQEALDYTRLLLEKVINQLGREKPGSLGYPLKPGQRRVRSTHHTPACLWCVKRTTELSRLKWVAAAGYPLKPGHLSSKA